MLYYYYLLSESGRLQSRKQFYFVFSCWLHLCNCVWLSVSLFCLSVCQINRPTDRKISPWTWPTLWLRFFVTAPPLAETGNPIFLTGSWAKTKLLADNTANLHLQYFGDINAPILGWELNIRHRYVSCFHNKIVSQAVVGKNEMKKGLCF